MKIDWLAKLLLTLIALGVWANVFSHPREVRASTPTCSDAEFEARQARSAAEEAKKEIRSMRCGTTDFNGNIAEVDGWGHSTCITLPDLKTQLESRIRNR